MHLPVLKKEVIHYLEPKANENFIDCSVGEGGHTISLLKKNKPNGKVLGIEIDSELYQKIRSGLAKIQNRLILVNDSYINLEKIIKKYKFKSIKGILIDLGLSTWHLKESKRGFSFLKNEPLEMRYNLNNPLTAQEIINHWSETEIEKILKEYSQERFSKRITKEIINQRKVKPIKTTFQLVEIIKKTTPSWYHHKKIHFATRTFQSLRIAVNDELNNLKKVLGQAIKILDKKGKLVIISFHSLEDGIVKNFFQQKAKENLIKILTEKPIRPSIQEIKVNPSSRSAKLRACSKL